ncbi:glycosyltransferase family A protein [Chondromyces apiculatus]|uniref:Glycosyl transferase, family 2 n=1 Tax=Chondromyces apiculatus DSM 436 TaxID=1192034 RepID=A0A017T6U4_9BACT|nr:glycosyltransferase family A protein [Chondromyces apiculatus]EYF04944.1 glycosyl transferase, family 2 [Chondromyces apiculatus DSM 436]
MTDLSVIVPTTGHRPALLRRALTSILSQAIHPLEILVIVDDEEAALDRVMAQVEGAACRVLATGRRAGVGAARNHGARVARARYLCFLDDDDVWKPGYLAAVFAEGPVFDLALTAFEKHTSEGARPEKVPPEVLERATFLVANPGLRGSNLVLTRDLFQAAGGFSEHLPSFNDMDFGLRLVEARPARYRRITEPLVEYHAHQGERLSRRGSSAIAPGMEHFLVLHGPEMDHRQEAAFRARAIALWEVDPWALPALERRLERALTAGGLAPRFPGLLHAAETALLEATCRADADVDAAQAFIDRLCLAFERERTAPRLQRLRIVTITTDTPGAVAGLLSSLQRALERSSWRCSQEGPLVEILFVRNDREPEVHDEHRAFLEAWCDRRISVLQQEIPVRARALSLTEARVFAFRAARERGWSPSPATPLWFLDEDFRFEMLVPSIQRGFRRIPGGSLLHRLESLALQCGHRGVDALVGSNSGAPPVPALGTLRRQLIDLTSRSGEASSLTSATPAQHLSALLGRRDPYYDLSKELAAELHVPLRAAWWRESGEWTWDDIIARLQSGLPVTRPALPSLHGAHPTAWGDLEPATVAGGNTLLLAPTVLRADAFVQARWQSLRSRRGDTAWCLTCQRDGARILQASFPLLHDRAPRRGAHGSEAASRELLADALGVGLYETLRELGRAEREEIERRANWRLSALLENLEAAALMARAATSALPPDGRSALASFILQALALMRRVRFEGIELVDRFSSAALST